MDNPALIPFDCGDEEIGLIIKRALQDLRASADEILSQANKRINDCQQRLASYNRRLAFVEQKFDQMKQSDDVPLITSPAEFPGKIHLSRSLVFRRSSSATPFTKRQQILRHESCPKPISIKEMVLRKNGYRFIFPKGKHNEKPSTKRIENQQILSLIRPKKKKQGIIKAEDFYNLKMTSTSADNLYASNGDFASNSLLIYDHLKAVDSADPFTYKPGMGNLTEFDLPEMLPQLTGTSSNVYAKKESLFGIGKSDDEDEDIFGEVTKRKTDVDLTARSTFYMRDEPISRRSTRSDIKLPEPSTPNLPIQKPALVVAEQQQIIIEAPPIIEPPKAIESEIPVAPPRSVDIVKSVVTTSSIPPAPPPPPPPGTLLASIPSPPGRADLMQAIRAAGGIKKAGLKKIEAQEDDDVEKPAKKPSSKAPESGDDLMSSLSKALERRRKGISGKTAKKFDALEKSGKQSTSNSTFSTLRELIPHQPTKDSDSAESGNEEDWK